MGLELYFLSDPRTSPDLTGALADEAELVRNHLPVRNLPELVYRALGEATNRKSRISSLVISGHGGPNHIEIGGTSIYVTDLPAYSATLALLTPHFAPGAAVTLWGCQVGNATALMKRLSAIWHGVKVQAMTGDITTWKFLIWGGTVEEGDRVICFFDHCWIDNRPFNPRRPTGDVADFPVPPRAG
jgi:uncharacterized protein DUF4347